MGREEDFAFFLIDMAQSEVSSSGYSLLQLLFK
jgi:hypothetical protein